MLGFWRLFSVGLIIVVFLVWVTIKMIIMFQKYEEKELKKKIKLIVQLELAKKEEEN